MDAVRNRSCTVFPCHIRVKWKSTDRCDLSASSLADIEICFALSSRNHSLAAHRDVFVESGLETETVTSEHPDSDCYPSSLCRADVLACHVTVDRYAVKRSRCGGDFEADRERLSELCASRIVTGKNDRIREKKHDPVRAEVD